MKISLVVLVGLSSIAGASWRYASNYVSPAKQAQFWVSTTRLSELFLTHSTMSSCPFFDKLNSSLSIGGCRFDVELDEVSVERGHGIVWLRYLAVVRRGSSLVWLERLPYRITTAGQGGGGPIWVAKLYGSLLLESEDPCVILTVLKLIGG